MRHCRHPPGCGAPRNLRHRACGREASYRGAGGGRPTGMFRSSRPCRPLEGPMVRKSGSIATRRVGQACCRTRGRRSTARLRLGFGRSAESSSLGISLLGKQPPTQHHAGTERRQGRRRAAAPAHGRRRRAGRPSILHCRRAGHAAIARRCMPTLAARTPCSRPSRCRQACPRLGVTRAVDMGSCSDRGGGHAAAARPRHPRTRLPQRPNRRG